MAELTELRERVRLASGPDRELDRDIEEALKLGIFRAFENDEDALEAIGIGPGPRWPSYTASVDAALALVEKMLPGTMQASGSMEEGPFCRLVTPSERRGPPACWGYFDGTGKTQCLAILSALLAALAKGEKP